MQCAAMQHVFTVARRVAALLDGATDPDPAQHGLTTEEERAASTSTQVLHAHYASHIALSP